MRLNKKAQETESLWWFVDILLFALIFIFMMQYIGNVGEQTTFQKKILAKDMALLIDTLQAAPGNLYIEYPHDTLWFGMAVDSDSIEIFEREKDPPNLRQKGFFLGEEQTIIEQKTLVPPSGYQSKKTFVQKYLPLFARIKQEPIDKGQTLNLSFTKTSGKIGISSNQHKPALSSVLCFQDTLPQTIILVKETEANSLFPAQNNRYVIQELDTLPVKDEEKTYVFIRFVDSTQPYFRSHYNAEAKNNLLSSLSCRITELYLSSENTPAAIEAASIPMNEISLKRKLGIEQDLQNMVFIEIGIQDKPTSEQMGKIRNTLYTLSTQ